MKISDKEVQAALSKYYSFKGSTSHDNMRAALSAAYAVRKARKAAKRAKAKPSILDEDQQEALRNADQQEPEFKVGDRVVHSLKGFGTITTIDKEDKFTPYLISFDGGGVWTNTDYITHSPAKPESNGKFEVGKAYRTRDGERAEIEGTLSGSYQFHGYAGNKSNGRVWTDCGKILDGFEFNHADDLIGPWED